MKKKTLKGTAVVLAAAMLLGCVGCGAAETAQQGDTQTVSTALPRKAMTPKSVDANPYMSAGDANIHHDCYNTDSTDEVLPMGIYSEINVSYETDQCQCFSGCLF